MPVTALRRGALSVSVFDGVDLLPTARGVLLPGGAAGTEVLVAWRELAAVCAGYDPASAAGRHRLAGLLRLRRRLAGLGPEAAGWVRDRAVALALPPGHVDHLGPAWLRRRLPGGALHLGLGLDEPVPAGSGVIPLPPTVVAGLGLTPEELWPSAAARIERYSAVAAELVRRDGAHATMLRPVAGCDPLSLLAGRRLRTALAEGDGSGMRALAVPNRTRGWFDLSRVDPAYVALAWQLTDAPERGLSRPLLVTRDAVTLALVRGDLTRPAVETR